MSETRTEKPSATTKSWPLSAMITVIVNVVFVAFCSGVVWQKMDHFTYVNDQLSAQMVELRKELKENTKDRYYRTDADRDLSDIRERMRTLEARVRSLELHDVEESRGKAP